MIALSGINSTNALSSTKYVAQTINEFYVAFGSFERNLVLL